MTANRAHLMAALLVLPPRIWLHTQTQNPHFAISDELLTLAESVYPYS